jgi:hypothetical protein
VTINQVLSRDYKSQINAIAAGLADGAQSGSCAHFGKYAKALGIFKSNMLKDDLDAAEKERKIWQESGLPQDMKRINAVKNGRKALQSMAEQQFNEFGIRSLTWTFHEKLDGSILLHW